MSTSAPVCQQPLWPLPAADVPTPSDYDVLIDNNSGGKDSTAALDVLVREADKAGVRDRIVVVHADLGEAEWPGTKEIAAEQAAHYGLRFEVVRREITDEDGGTQPDQLLDYVQRRGAFPDAARRWCTSDFKRAPVRRLMTRLVRELDEKHLERPVRLLNVMGLRAAESPARARRPAFRNDPSASNGRRTVDEWLPIHDWTTEQVWQRIAETGAPVHPAYSAGMSRLSCRLCILASKPDLLLSAQLNPQLAERYAQVEASTGHRFRLDLSMAEIIEQAAPR